MNRIKGVRDRNTKMTSRSLVCIIECKWCHHSRQRVMEEIWVRTQERGRLTLRFPLCDNQPGCQLDSRKEGTVVQRRGLAGDKYL
jgi:hypothetical protein